jgi:hypothetical protein
MEEWIAAVSVGEKQRHVNNWNETIRLQLRLSTELTVVLLPAILCAITERNDNEQEEYAHMWLPRELAVWCEAGVSAGAEWPWELRSEPREVKGKR